MVERLREIGGHAEYSEEVTKGVQARIAAERDGLAAEATRLAPAIARLQDESKRLLEALAPATGLAKQHAEERFAQTCREFDELQRRAKEVERQRGALRNAEADAGWVAQVLADFDGLWKAMTPLNRRRLVAALVETVVVDEAAATMRITFAEIPPGSSGEEARA